MRSISVVFALAAAPLTAQLGAPLPNPGFPLGSHVLQVQNIVFAATGMNHDAILGVARSQNGSYWISARRSPRSSTNPHVLFELNSSGALVGTYPVPNSSVSRWGLRDLAYDGSRYLYGGWEGDRVLAFDTVGRAFAASRDFVVPPRRTFRLPRALAYDPAGDSGRGSLWTANWNSEHVEFDRAGNILRRVPNMQPDTSGAAYDPVRRTIWWFGQSGSDHPSATIAVVATEMDLATLAPTGQKVLGDTSFPGLTPGGFAGGAEFYESGGRTALLLTAQTNSDVVYELWGRFGYGNSTGGSISFDGGAALVGNAAFGVTLDGSPESFANLIFGFGEAVLPLGPPTFVAGTEFLLDPAATLIAGLPGPVAGGRARYPLPIPNDPNLAGVDIYFQWLQYSVSGGQPILPLRLSDGGKIRIHP